MSREKKIILPLKEYEELVKSSKINEDVTKAIKEKAAFSIDVTSYWDREYTTVTSYRYLIVSDDVASQLENTYRHKIINLEREVERLTPKPRKKWWKFRK